jgi:nucleoside-diphosphate-sugar epimerase
MKPTIAIMGGTGKSGRYLVEKLLREEYHIKILLRDPEKFLIKSPFITPVKGDARNYDDIYKLTIGCDAVLSTLGQPKGESPIFSDATTNVLRAMDTHGIKRYVVTTGVNVDTCFDKKGPEATFATAWMKTNYAATTGDKQKEYELLFSSNQYWTLVRLPFIELTDDVSDINVNLEDCPGPKISAASLANFLIEQLGNEAYCGKAPFIANV